MLRGIRRGIPLFAFVVVAAAAQPAAAAAPLVQSNFSNGANGWKVTGDPVSTQPNWFASGGSSGGYISATDTQQGELMYWKAPEKFLGDQSAAFDGHLQFAYRQSSDANQDPSTDDAVVMKGGGRTISANGFPPVGTEWTLTTYSLREGLWKKPSGALASDSRIQTVLGSLESLKIRAEFEIGPDTDDLDSVALYAGS